MCHRCVGPVGGQPTPLAASCEFPGGDALQESVEWNPKPGVSGGCTPWLAGYMARPASKHPVNYRLNQVNNCSWDSYKYPSADGIHTSHSTCSSPLVKVLV
jgi:hypothetical protein